jgi:MoaA/NifB/PqqE/SkfB family radical SAM enzyme
MNLLKLKNKRFKQIFNMARIKMTNTIRPVCTHDPIDLMVFITNRCNLKCRTCPFTNQSPYSPPDRISDLTVEMFRRVLDNYSGAQLVGLVGGEPLLHPQLPELIGIAADHRMSVNVSTNGTLLNSEWSRKLLGQPLGFLNVSLDAADAADYQRVRGGSREIYEKILTNIRTFNSLRVALKSRTLLYLSYVTDQYNLTRLPEFAALAKELNADRVFCQNLLPYQCSDITIRESSLSDTPDNRRRLSELRLPDGIDVLLPSLSPAPGSGRTASCRHPFRMLAFDGGGNLSPCCVIPPHPKYGSLMTDLNAWRRAEALIKIRNEMIQAKEASAEICLECWERYSLGKPRTVDTKSIQR